MPSQSTIQLVSWIGFKIIKYLLIISILMLLLQLMFLFYTTLAAFQNFEWYEWMHDGGIMLVQMLGIFGTCLEFMPMLVAYTLIMIVNDFVLIFFLDHTFYYVFLFLLPTFLACVLVFACCDQPQDPTESTGKNNEKNKKKNQESSSGKKTDDQKTDDKKTENKKKADS